MARMRFSRDIKWHGSEDEFRHIVAGFFEHDYRDRGMKKWQGYFLSDHTAALKKQADAEAEIYEPLPKMPQADIRSILNRAYANHNTVEIQLSDVNSDTQFFPPLRGKVSGTDGRTKDALVLDDGTTVPISKIRNIRLIVLPGEDGSPVN